MIYKQFFCLVFLCFVKQIFLLLHHDRAAPKFYKTTQREIYRYSEPHLSLDKYDASYRPKLRVTFDITNENKPSGDIIDHREVGRPTEDVGVVKNNIAIDNSESNEKYINVTNNREPTEDRRGTNDDVPIMKDGKIN
jgi:hypothetical protein